MFRPPPAEKVVPAQDLLRSTRRGVTVGAVLGVVATGILLFVVEPTSSVREIVGVLLVGAGCGVAVGGALVHDWQSYLWAGERPESKRLVVGLILGAGLVGLVLVLAGARVGDIAGG